MSAAARVALTALNFFLKNQARPFPRDQIDAALAYLNVPEATRPRVNAAIEALEPAVSR